MHLFCLSLRGIIDTIRSALVPSYTSNIVILTAGHRPSSVFFSVSLEAPSSCVKQSHGPKPDAKQQTSLLFVLLCFELCQHIFQQYSHKRVAGVEDDRSRFAYLVMGLMFGAGPHARIPCSTRFCREQP